MIKINKIILYFYDMEKHLIKYFVDQYKMNQDFKRDQKNNYIDFDKYFKYSGKTEQNTYIERNKCEVVIESNNPIVKFFYQFPNLTEEEIGKVFQISRSSVKKALDNFYMEKGMKQKQTICI